MNNSAPALTVDGFCLCSCLAETLHGCRGLLQVLPWGMALSTPMELLSSLFQSCQSPGGNQQLQAVQTSLCVPWERGLHAHWGAPWGTDVPSPGDELHGFFYSEGGEALEKITKRCGGCPIPRGIQGQAWWGSEQPDLSCPISCMIPRTVQMRSSAKRSFQNAQNLNTDFTG